MIGLGNTSYFRKQFDEYYNKVKSNIKPVTHEVPHGSVLGASLLLVYINGLPNSLDILKSILLQMILLYISGTSLPNRITAANKE